MSLLLFLTLVCDALSVRYYDSDQIDATVGVRAITMNTQNEVIATAAILDNQSSELIFSNRMVVMGGSALTWVAMHALHGWVAKPAAWAIKKHYLGHKVINVAKLKVEAGSIAASKTCHYCLKLIMLYVIHLRKGSEGRDFEDPIAQELNRIRAMYSGEMPKEQACEMIAREEKATIMAVVDEPLLIEKNMTAVQISHGFEIVMEAFHFADQMHDDDLRSGAQQDQAALAFRTHLLSKLGQGMTAHVVCKFLSQLVRGFIGGWVHGHFKSIGQLLKGIHEKPGLGEFEEMGFGGAIFLAMRYLDWIPGLLFQKEEKEQYASPDHSSIVGVYVGRVEGRAWKFKVYDLVPGSLRRGAIFIEFQLDIELDMHTLTKEANPQPVPSNEGGKTCSIPRTNVQCWGKYELDGGSEQVEETQFLTVGVVKAVAKYLKNEYRANFQMECSAQAAAANGCFFRGLAVKVPAVWNRVARQWTLPWQTEHRVAVAVRLEDVPQGLTLGPGVDEFGAVLPRIAYSPILEKAVHMQQIMRANPAYTGSVDKALQNQHEYEQKLARYEVARQQQLAEAVPWDPV